MLCIQSEGLDILSEKNIISITSVHRGDHAQLDALNTHHSGIPEQQQQQQQQQHCSNNKINNNSNNNDNNNSKNNNNSK